jgi:hypothetical protein
VARKLTFDSANSKDASKRALERLTKAGKPEDSDAMRRLEEKFKTIK